jgi:O-antigen/teichoic acid export membrane protein
MNNSFSEEDVKKVAKVAGTTLIGSSIGKGLFFLSQVIVARILGVEVFGLYVLGFAAVKICEIIARLGLNTGGMRFVSIYKDTNPSKLKGILVSATGITFLNGILIGGVLYFSSDWIAQHVFRKSELANYLQLFAYGIPFVATMTVVSFLLQGFHTMKYTVYTREFVQPITNILLMAGFYYLGFHLEGIIYAFILSHLIALVAGIFYFNRIFPQSMNKDIKPDYEFKKLISYSTPLLFIGFLHYFLLWTDTLMLGFLSTSKDVGIYRAASQIPLVMAFFPVAVSAIYAPLAADLFQRKEMQRLSSILKITTRWVSYATVPIFIFIVFSAKDILMIFGKEYSETGYIVLIILSFGQLINCVTGDVGYTLTMTGKQKIELVNSVGLVFLNVLLNLLLIPEYGVMGAAISSGVSVALVNIIRLLEIHFIYKMVPFSQKTANILLPAFASIIIILLFHQDRNVYFVIKFFTNMFLIIAIFISSLYITKIADEDKYLIKTIKSKMINRILK